MAWSDLRGQSLSFLDSLLSRRATKKEAGKDRISTALSDLSQQIYGSQEAEKQRGFTAGESVLAREHEAGLSDAQIAAQERQTGVQIEANKWLQELVGKQGLERIGAQATADLGLQKAGSEQQAALQTQVDDARAALQGQADDAAMARVEAGVAADTAAADALWAGRSKEYETPQSFFSPGTGKTYRWQTQEEFELAQLEMENDNLIAAQKTIAELQKLDPDSAGRVWEAYQDAKAEIFNPSVMGDNPGEWIAIQDRTPGGELETAFLEALAARGLTDAEEINTALALFRRWIAAVPEPGAGENTGSWYIRPEQTSVDRERQNIIGGLEKGVAEQGLTSPYGNAALLAQSNPFLYLGQTGTKYPTGVAGAAEQGLYDQLMNLFRTQEKAGRPTTGVDAQMRRLVNENVGENDPEMMKVIRDLLSEVSRRGL